MIMCEYQKGIVIAGDSTYISTKCVSRPGGLTPFFLQKRYYFYLGLPYCRFPRLPPTRSIVEASSREDSPDGNNPAVLYEAEELPRTPSS